MERSVRTVTAIIALALVATTFGQQDRKRITQNTRPITRAQVEALFASVPGGKVLSAAVHAPRSIAVLVWPAADADLIKLLPQYKGWVVQEAVLRATPGVVPTLAEALRMRIGMSTVGHASCGPYSSPLGKLIDTLAKIPGASSSRVLHGLVASTDPQLRIGALHGLSVQKRAFSDRREEVKRAIEREIARDLMSAEALGPGYLMLASPSESRRLLRRVLDEIVAAGLGSGGES